MEVEFREETSEYVVFAPWLESGVAAESFEDAYWEAIRRRHRGLG